MQTFLVVERPERLETPAGEFEILHGSVMSAKGLDSWAPRHLETAPGTAFFALVEAAKAKGLALFAIPQKGAPADAPGLVIREFTAGENTFLVRHAPDWTGNAQLRWKDYTGGVREVEAPAWLIDFFVSQAQEVAQLRGELKAKTAELETTGKALDGMAAECQRLKAGMPVPPSARATRGRKKSPFDIAPPVPVEAPDKAPESPAIASAPPPANDGAKSVADVKAELQTMLEKEAAVSAPGKKKYRGSGGDAD